MGWDGVDLFSYASESLVNTTYVGISLVCLELILTVIKVSKPFLL